MLSKIVSFILGEVELYTGEEHSDKLVSVIAEQGIDARISCDRQNGGIRVFTSPAGAKKIARALDKSSIIVYINSVCGLKASLFSQCKRVGILLGICIFLALLYASTLLVFKIEISGSDKIAGETIRSELADFGIRVGARLSDIDKNAVSGRFLQLHPELSWAAINFKGNTVCLEIREKSGGQSGEEQKHEFLVAKYDGVVKNVLVYSGKSAVSAGTVVKKGDLLIGGYISGNGLQYTDNPALRFEGAEGAVMAQVSDSITVTVEYEKETVAVKKTGKSGKIYSFLGFEVGENRSDSEVVFLPARNVTVFGIIELPIVCYEFYGVENEIITEALSADQALSQAKKSALDELTARVADGELLEMEITEKTDENGVTVTLSYTCIVNIAVPQTEK